MDNKMYFGGVEGGATHSNLVICDEQGTVVGTSKGPGTNHWNLGIDLCADKILEMLHDAKREAGLAKDRPLDALGLTLSGCEQESSNEELATRVREKDRYCAKSIYVASDTAGSLVTGAPSGGMVLIAGTGSNALLRTADGKQYGCGGWGHLLGDEGAAYWIAHKAVKTVFDEMDNLKLSPHPVERVWEVIREHFNAETRADLLPHAYKHFNKSHFAGVTLKISHLASQGDPLAQHLFSEAGSALASHIAALASKSSAGLLRVVCVGSVWNSWDALKTGALRVLNQREVHCELQFVRLRVSSAMGAAWLAAKQINYDLPRNDAAYCQIFYTYTPNNINGNCNGIDNHGCGCVDWSF